MLTQKSRWLGFPHFPFFSTNCTKLATPATIGIEPCIQTNDEPESPMHAVVNAGVLEGEVWIMGGALFEVGAKSITLVFPHLRTLVLSPNPIFQDTIVIISIISFIIMKQQLNT